MYHIVKNKDIERFFIADINNLIAGPEWCKTIEEAIDTLPSTRDHMYIHSYFRQTKESSRIYSLFAEVENLDNIKEKYPELFI